MATFGVVEQTSGTSWRSVSSGNTGYFVGGNFPGGTITAVKLRVGNRVATSVYNDWDVALYSGGSSSGPSGATKVWQSKHYTSSTDLGSQPGTFYSVVDGSDAAPNVVVGSGYLWIVVRSPDGLQIAYLNSNGANSGDFQTFGVTGRRATTNNAGGSWDDPFPGNATSTEEVNQAFVVYTPSSGVTIDDASDEVFENGETVTITGSGFGASQGAGAVYISPTDSIADINKVTQTVNSWSPTSISITVAQGSLSQLTNAYLFVKDNGGTSNASGRVVQIEPKVYVRHRLIDPVSGAARASVTGITMHVWRSFPSGNPDQTITGVASDGSGDLAQKINRGSLTDGDDVWVMLAKSGSPGEGSLLNLTPSYE